MAEKKNHTKQACLKIKEKIIQNAALPKDVLFGLSVIQILGRKELTIENFGGIIEYTEDAVRVRTKEYQIQIDGAHLQIGFYSKEELKIEGQIDAVRMVMG